jgi:hypothetical protein
MSDIRIRTRAVIREVLSERTCRAALRNGKLIFGYTEPGDVLPPLAAGERCTVLLSLCDFSEGRIVPDDLGSVVMRHPIVEGDPAE